MEKAIFSRDEQSQLEIVISKALKLIHESRRAFDDQKLTFWEGVGLLSPLFDFAKSTLQGVQHFEKFREMDKGSRRLLIDRALERDDIYSTLGVSLGIGSTEADFEALERIVFMVLSVIQTVIDLDAEIKNLR